MRSAKSLAKGIAVGMGAVCIPAFALVLASRVSFFALPELEHYPASTILTDCHGVPLRIGLGEADRDCRPIPVDAASDWAGKAIIAAEDKRFERHFGIDPLAIARALLQNLQNGRRISGASTLSTQIIRLAEPRPRTLRTKIIEALKAMRMEQRLPKREILEQYLNRAPFGSNLIGIESAARLYFGKSAGDLSLAEAAMLMGLPQAPSRHRPDRHPESARKRMNYVLERMQSCGFITPALRDGARAQPLPVLPRARPFEAPHFCDSLLRKSARTGTIKTTLDSNLQAGVERILAAHAPSLRHRNIRGAAVVVLEVRSGAVRALIGSPDYHDRENSGMVNGALASRSPGSALKPFIYAMALDQGIITPESKIEDAPMYFRQGDPVNFDGTFRGTVTVREALVHSLNIPAMKLAERLGQRRVVEHLRALGLETLTRPAGEYGLGIALGSGEVRLLDLVNAYASLARGGIYKPCRRVEDRGVPAGTRACSAAAAFLVADILGGDERGTDIFGHHADAHLPRIAWKTGTSSGFRDAWTIAWNPEYVVGIWLGNPGGAGNPALTGAKAAAPVAGDVFRWIYAGRASPWFIRPESIAERRLADGSTGLYIPGISQTANPSASHETPRIVAPLDGSQYRRTDRRHARQELELKARGAGNAILYWFVNEEPLGTTDGKTSLYWPLERGNWQITCCREDGWTAQSSIRVE